MKVVGSISCGVAVPLVCLLSTLLRAWDSQRAAWHILRILNFTTRDYLLAFVVVIFPPPCAPILIPVISEYSPLTL